MRELPILFSAPMVRVILEGRKTVTRRPVKLRYPREIEDVDDGSKWPWHPDYVTGGEWDGWARCPYGESGDRLYVRETHFDARNLNEGRVLFPADGDASRFGWTPSIHMPRKLARIWIELTAVRVERLQDISEQSAWDEGIQDFMGGPTPWKGVLAPTSVHGFAGAWEAMHGPGSWADNPRVWAVAFRRTEHGAKLRIGVTESLLTCWTGSASASVGMPYEQCG